MNTVELGPLMLRWDYIALIVAGMAGLFMIRLKLKSAGIVKQQLMDLLTIMVMIVLLFWKLGSVFFQPAELWKNPQKLLFASGTFDGAIIGLAIAILYAVIRLRKDRISLVFFLDVLTYGMLTLYVVQSLFGWQYGKQTHLPWGVHVGQSDIHYHPLNVYMLLLAGSLLLWLWRGRKRLGDGKIFSDFLMYFGLGLLLISFFEQQFTFYIYLSIKQWFFLIMVVVGFLYSLFVSRSLHDNDG